MTKNNYFLFVLLMVLSRQSSCQDLKPLDSSIYENNFIKYMVKNRIEFQIPDSTLLLIDSVPGIYNFCSQLNAFKGRLDMDYIVKCDSVKYESSKRLIINKNISDKIRITERKEVKNNIPKIDFLSIKFAQKIKYKHNVFLFISASPLGYVEKNFIVKSDENANILNCYFFLTIE